MSNHEYDFCVSVPEKCFGNGKRGGRNDVIRNMPIGASKFFPKANQQTVMSSVRAMQIRGTIAFKVTSRTVTENGVKGVRVWRVGAE